ncbi:fibulin-2 [Betta splendens]|uniref:Fibulin-2 n=1 Tax=Betta splendens TaxID=158456 RepID=A0A6P7MK56_BETSP|nr:fibulin-2 [Betta splendens]XP_055365070.1 fibulin-2 [Betta splendens]XP_055365072.1 fibulin-2 [Betta splendens]XP_055365073.1 fibulin-2 [Betta splendens]
MRRFPGAEAALLGCTLLIYLTVSLCQRDCTGVDCPQLDSCIQEVLESGGCCASCLQKGCTCEGYQYYDCVNAGFKNGKVPEGESYFVDYGSTECSCPAGGGRISCHFISCPEIPPNCIEVLEPADAGCMQCERVGCIHGGKKYEAGDSFHIDPCRVCHCPNEGGELMCYPVSDCDPEEVHRPIAASATEENAASRRDRYPYTSDETSHRKHLTTTYHHAPNGKVPLLESPPLDKDETGDYDYGQTDFPETHPQSPPLTILPSSSDRVIPLFRDRSDRDSAFLNFDGESKLELIERYGVHDPPANKNEVTEHPQSTDRPYTHGDTTTAWQHPQGSASVQSVPSDDQSPQSHLGSPWDEHSLRSVTFPLNQDLGTETHPKYPQVVPESETNPSAAYHQNASDSVVPRRSHSQSNVSHWVGDVEGQTNEQSGAESDHAKESQSIVAPDSEEEVNANDAEKDGDNQKVAVQSGKAVAYNTEPAQQESEDSSYERTTPKPSTDTLRGPEDNTTPMAPATTTTTQTPVRLELKESGPSTKLEEDEAKKRNEPVLLMQPDEGPGVSAEDLLLNCCTAGQRWAVENHQCNHMPLMNSDRSSTCSVAQKQCCLSSVKESQCESGMTSARRGDTCEVEKDQCTYDSYEVCCSCCALGLWAHSEGNGCNAHQYLAYPCSHIFLTCCEEEEGPSQIPLKTKQRPKTTAMPRRVSDSKFPKEAFSIRGTDEAANAVEEQDDVDQCGLYAAQLCQHTCVNVRGSYRCDCHKGYVLQQDRHSCTPVSPDENNRVREDVPVFVPTQTSTSSTADPTTSSPIQLDPCAENGPCSQQCTVLAGWAHCSCFPGFSLLTDGHTCHDVDECASGAHSCRPSERCVNTVGSFVCELQVTCPDGYQLRNSVCEDLDECVQQTHNCGSRSACENTLGSFLCKPKNKCIIGFSPDAHGNCVDINECSGLNGLCSSGFNCINTVGSYTCQKKVIMCSHGFHASADGAKCVDIDECQMGTHRCAVGQICHNLPGSYRCDCQTGYQYDALHKACTDVNECWRYTGRLCSQTCENTPGSYHCSCTAGFSLAIDGKNCEDVNECDRNPCSQECANIYGSYQCYCRQGYHLKEDGHTCEDIDECSQSIGNLCAFQCVNTAGSYRCACPPQGYIMSANGHACRDVDECTTNTHNCSVGQTCYNLQGGFRCLSFNCPPNYKKVSDTRCERISCPMHSLDCQNSPVRITYYQLSFKTNIITPAQIFRIGPSPAYSGDHIVMSITKGNEESYFSTRKLNSFTGAVYLQRPLRQPRDFLIDVEMKLLRQGTFTSFIARIYVFITSSTI